MRFCITHQMIVGNDEVVSDLDECLITSCPPPFAELTYEEVTQLVEPSPEELILMDMNAEVLLSDLGVEDE